MKGKGPDQRKSMMKKHKETKKQEIKYAMPAKPLDFSFRDLKNIESLRLTEQRGGDRRSIEELEKEEKMRQDSLNAKQDNKMTEEEDHERKNVVKKKQEQILKTDESDIIEARIFDNKVDNAKGGKGGNQGGGMDFEERKDLVKKIVKYQTYTNAVILHNNQIGSLQSIHNVFMDILVNPKFDLANFKSKVDLIQWIDISSNHLDEIHPDILELKHLKILYAHANYINEIKRVEVLSRCPCLINLTLHGNPIEQIKGFRHFIVELVPTLEKFDFTLVSEKELDIIQHRGSRYGEKRDMKTWQVLEYPALHEKFKRFPVIMKDDKGEDKDEH